MSGCPVSHVIENSKSADLAYLRSCIEVLFEDLWNFYQSMSYISDVNPALHCQRSCFGKYCRPTKCRECFDESHYQNVFPGKEIAYPNEDGIAGNEYEIDPLVRCRTRERKSSSRMVSRCTSNVGHGNVEAEDTKSQRNLQSGIFLGGQRENLEDKSSKVLKESKEQTPPCQVSQSPPLDPGWYCCVINPCFTHPDS